MLRKTRYYLKTQGPARTLGLILRHLYGSARRGLFALLFYLRYPFGASGLRRALAGKTVYVVLPTVEWDFLFARAQQLAAEFGRREGFAAVYLTWQKQYDRVLGWKEVQPGVFVANAAIAGRLDRLTAKAQAVIAAVFDLRGASLLDRFHSDRIVYEYVDDLHLLVSGAEDFSKWEQRHRSLLQKADLSVASARRLYEQILPFAKFPLLLENAADYPLFSAPAAPNPQLLALRERYACVIGYYGALAEWFDYETVKAAAAARPDWCWVLIGTAIGPALEDSGLLSLPNVVRLPAVPYRELPACLAAMDLGVIPFVQNEITEAVSPVKLFEYMAAAKPVISSDLPECRRYAAVRIYHSPEELVELAARALQDRTDPEYQALLARTAGEHTWAARVDAELAALGWEA